MEERELQENEDKKEYLKSYIPKERAARRLEKEIEELRLSKQSPALICDGMPHGTDKTDLSAYMAKLDELERKLIKAHAERVNVYTSIFLDIEKLEEEREKELLTLRYLKGINARYDAYVCNINDILNSMLQRCYNKKHKAYKYYGGRGIEVCAEWKESFETFYEWALKNGYAENLTIDRVDNNGNYEPSNCRWADMTMQGLNRGIQSNNTSGHKGISLIKKTGKYRAYIKIKGKQIHLGHYDTLHEAIMAREKAEEKYIK